MILISPIQFYIFNPYIGASILVFICAKANKIDVILQADN